MKKVKLFALMMIITLVIIDCTEKKDDKTTTLAGLLLLSRRTSTGGTTTGTRAQVTQVSAGRSAATSSASAARSAARTSFRFDKTKGLNKKELMTFLKEKYAGQKMPAWSKSQSTISTIPTATCTNARGGACTDSSTSVVFSGTDNCANGGTSTLNSLASTLSGADRDNLQITITGGSVSFAACGLSPTDFVNYPATTRVTITSGTITPRGTYKLTDSSSTSGAVTTYTSTSVEDLTVNGTVVIGGNSVTMTNLKSTTSLTEVFKDSDLKYLKSTGVALTSTELAADTTFSTVFGLSGITTANGSLVLSGTVSGAEAGANLTLNNRVINWKFLCSKSWATMTEADWASDTVCTYTVN